MANKQLNAVITIGGAITGGLKSALGTTQTKLRAIGSTVRDLEREQKRMQSTIKNSGSLGAPIYHLQRRYETVTKQIERARREQERMNRAVKGMDAGRSKMGSAAQGLGIVGAVASVGVLPVVQAASFEKAMLGVAKQVEGARDANGKLTPTYFAMARSIQQLGREIPIATNEIAAMVTAGARMGVAKDELIGFTRTAAMMASAFELPADELADNMGKIAKLYGIPIPAIGELADTINYLDDNAISKGGDIIEYLTRTGGVAGSVKVTGKEMSALGSTLLTLGERTETASTATNAFFQKLAAADKGTKKFRTAMADLGLSTAEIQKGMQTDAQGTVLKVLEAVQKLPAEQRLGMLVDIVGLEHSDTLAKLAGNVAEYRKQIEMAGGEKAAGSMSREFAATFATTAAQWEILKNKATEFSVNIGSVLLPMVNRAMGVIGAVAGATADWAREHPVLAKNMLLVVGTALAGAAAFNTLKFAVAAVPTALNALRLVMMTNPLGLALTAIAVGATLIYENWGPISAFFKKVWGAVVNAASVAWDFIKSAFLNTTPLGLIIKNWGPISRYFSGLFADIKATVGSVIDWVLRKIAAVGSAWTKTKEFFGYGDDAPAARPGAPAPRRAPPPPPMAGARGSRPAVNDNSQNNFYITQQPGQDGKSLARQAADELRKNQRGRGGSLYDQPRGY